MSLKIPSNKIIGGASKIACIVLWQFSYPIKQFYSNSWREIQERSDFDESLLLSRKSQEQKNSLFDLKNSRSTFASFELSFLFRWAVAIHQNEKCCEKCSALIFLSLFRLPSEFAFETLRRDIIYTLKSNNPFQLLLFLLHSNAKLHFSTCGLQSSVITIFLYFKKRERSEEKSCDNLHFAARSSLNNTKETLNCSSWSCSGGKFLFYSKNFSVLCSSFCYGLEWNKNFISRSQKFVKLKP